MARQARAVNPPQSLDEALRRAQAMLPGLGLRALYLGDDAAERLAAFARERFGPVGHVVCDENTAAADGGRLVSLLTAKGKRLTETRFGAAPLDATDTLGDHVAADGANADFFVAIGAGTLCDLAKHAGTRLHKPVLLYPTAASMNGYTSSIVALKVRGLKRTTPCDPAVGVFADPAAVATAPQRMVAAGVGDFLSKGSSASDWRVAHLLRGEAYDERAMVFYRGVQERVFAAAPGAGRGEPEAVAEILEALLLSGLSMLVAGSSAPASGGEHLISHYLDMKSALYGMPHDLHGAQVGVATIDCLRLWERVLTLDASRLDIDSLLDRCPGEAEIAAWIEEDWGATAPEVQAQWNAKSRNREALRAELEFFQRKADTLREAARRDFIPARQVAEAIASAGGPTAAEELAAPPGEYHKALKRARFIRNRFTILDLAAELGVL